MTEAALAAAEALAAGFIEAALAAADALAAGFIAAALLAGAASIFVAGAAVCAEATPIVIVATAREIITLFKIVFMIFLSLM